MPEVVAVSSVKTDQDLLAAIEEYFKRGRYAEITQAIGMHSILFDPEHTIQGQNRFYRAVLQMIKNKLSENLGKKYSSWYSEFAKIMDRIIADGQIVTDKSSSTVLASRRAAFGFFKSVDEFYFWSLDDRKLTLDQIIKYIEQTVAAYAGR